MDRQTLTAIIILSLGMTLIPLGDSAGKAMTQIGASAGFVACSRFALGALMLACLTGLGPVLPLLKDLRIWLRGLLLVSGVTAIQMALKTEALATVFGAFFIGPIISYALSVAFLKERVTTLQTLLLGVGFAGVICIAAPRDGGLALTPGLGFALLAGCCYGGYLTASRWIANLGTPKAVMLSQLIIGAIAMAPVAAFALPPLSLQMGSLVTGSALASMLGNLALVAAYQRAPASTLAPFVYVQLLSAAAFGWAFFGDWPDQLGVLGLGLLICSGLATIFAPKRA